MKKYPLAKPFITNNDIKSVTKVLQSSTLSRGPMLDEFESQFCKLTGCQYASAVSSGTAGLIVALQVLGIGCGDEVITVSFTVPATVNCIQAVGAKAVMVDIEESTLGMCPQALKAAITDKTKAIIVVHAFGKSANIEEIIQIANSRNIKVIEDACEAIGNTLNDKPLGSFADIGVFAFYPNKQITTGEGGMVVSNDKSIIDKVNLLRNHGRTMNGDLYDQVSFGWNFRLSEINAALGVTQLNKLNKIIKKRQKIASWYEKYLANVKLVNCPKFSDIESSSAWFVYVVTVPADIRDLVFEQLNQNGVQCSRYFAPVHLQPYYQHLGLQLPVTERIASQTLALPFYHELKKKDVREICGRINKTALALF
jgi:perosamine synthetase